MNETPKISVLIPVYNGAAFLAETLDSVLAQDFADMEILIGDDGSTDASVEIIQNYAARNPRIRWWRNEKNLGLTGNFNHCLRAARGEFIKFVLQDDKLLQPSALRQLAALLDAHPAVSLAVSASHVIDAESRLIETRDHFSAGVSEGKLIILTCLEENANRIGEPSLLMFRRADAARGFDPGYRQLVDLEMWFHLLERGDFAYTATPLCAFRQHSRQQTAINRQTRVGEAEAVVLFETYFAKPWLRRRATRQMLFAQIYALRNNYGDSAKNLIAAIRAELGAGWLAAFWLKRKILRPFKNLRRSYRKRFPRDLNCA